MNRESKLRESVNQIDTVQAVYSGLAELRESYVDIELLEKVNPGADVLGEMVVDPSAVILWIGKYIDLLERELGWRDEV